MNNILQGGKKICEDSDSFSVTLLHDFPWANVSFILVPLSPLPFKTYYLLSSDNVQRTWIIPEAHDNTPYLVAGLCCYGGGGECF